MKRRPRPTILIAKFTFAATLLVCVPAWCFSYPRVPSRHQTPGELCHPKSPNFTEYRYRERIPYCRRSVSNATKDGVYKAYGVPKAEQGHYTIDHLIPLSIGGSNTPKNLWPEHHAVKATRPHLEQEAFEAIRDGASTQKELVEQILAIKFDPSGHGIE